MGLYLIFVKSSDLCFIIFNDVVDFVSEVNDKENCIEMPCSLAWKLSPAKGSQKWFISN